MGPAINARTHPGGHHATTENKSDAGVEGDGSDASSLERAHGSANVPRGTDDIDFKDHHSADTPNDRGVAGDSSSAKPPDNEPSQTSNGQASRGTASPPEHVVSSSSTAAGGTATSGSSGDSHVSPKDAQAGQNRHSGQGTANQRGERQSGPSLGQEQSVTTGVGVAAARPMVPDKEDDDVVGGAPRHVSSQNYASKDSGAVMLESSPGSKGMNNLLVDSKDKYAISPCEEKQWAVFGLSEDIMVRTIKIISHEKYSSLVKDFQILASQTYPVNEWMDLGTFTAKFVQGEQTFDLPQPAFARYLKFKFLTHYGDEFYCTVSQLKVHGSTMLESFQHEWQLSSAEVREVQDSLMMTKKVHVKHDATGANGNAGAAPPTLSGGGGSSTPAGVTPPGHSETATNSRTPLSTASGESGVEHRPHAAAAATVPPLTEKRSVAGGDRPTAELTVEDIVRGVPTEMVVPATACSGATGVDGSCRGEMVADRTGAGAAGGVAGEFDPLAVEVPSMGTAVPGVAGSVGAGTSMNGVGSGGIDENAGEALHRVSRENRPAGERRTTADGNAGSDNEEAGGEAVPSEDKKSQGDDPSSKGAIEQGLGSGDSRVGLDSAVRGADMTIGDGQRAGEGSDEGGVGEQVVQRAQAGDVETPAPRKGIITSTMEAISKAVGGSDGGKQHISDDGKPEAAGAEEAVSDAVLGGGEAIPPTASSCDPAAGSECAVRTDDAVDTVGHDDDSEAMPSVSSGDADESAGSDASPLHRTAAGQSASVKDAGTGADRPADARQGTAGTGAAIPPSMHAVAGDDQEQSSTATHASGSVKDTGRASKASIDSDETEKMLEDGAAPVAVPEAESSLKPGTQAAGAEEKNHNIHKIEMKHSGLEVLEGKTNTASSASGMASTHTASPGLADARQDLRTHSMPEGVRAGSAEHQIPPIAEQEQVAGASEGLASPVTGEGFERKPLVLVEEADPVAKAAACLDRLSFSEFRDEVLARTQHAQQSVATGVTIGGQYESIFKTLMNKIKTLEINQSLFSLYIDEVHGCYQEVIGSMLKEQERARTSRSKLLDAHSASLMKIGDGWPAFQELQAKVTEVENRMLLTSMSWFTSLFCLVMMVFACVMKTCRVLGGRGSGRGNRERGERGGVVGGAPPLPVGGYYRRGKDRSASPSTRDFGFDRGSRVDLANGAIGKGAPGNGVTSATRGNGKADYDQTCGRCNGCLSNGSLSNGTLNSGTLSDSDHSPNGSGVNGSSANGHVFEREKESQPVGWSVRELLKT